MKATTCLARQSALLPFLAAAQTNEPPAGFRDLFNGKDFTGWTLPEGDGGHRKVLDGVIDYDAESESKAGKNLWTEKEFGDFTLRRDWRIKRMTSTYPMLDVLPDGSPSSLMQFRNVCVKELR